MPYVEMFVAGEVKGLARPRASTFRGHARMYDSVQNVNEKGRLQVHFMNAVKEKGLTYPFNCDGKGFAVKIDALFKVPKSFSRKKKEAAMNKDILPLKKPDADNIAKLVLDSLNGYAWEDDAKVAGLLVEKRYSEKEGIYVTICWEEPKDD